MTHPITPPPELIEDWIEIAKPASWKSSPNPNVLCTLAAQWGADQELLACGNYLKQCAAWEEEDVTEFYNYRRPKPKSPSLKERSLEGLTRLVATGEFFSDQMKDLDTIRRALEALPDD